MSSHAGHILWRGGAPRRDTLSALAASAKARGAAVTLIDLRAPVTPDDRSGKGGRLSPADEAAAARRLGLRYRSLSALDPKLLPTLNEALRHGDVYLHCMYGANRTGFAAGRYAVATGEALDPAGLARRDWEAGRRFEERRAGLKKR